MRGGPFIPWIVAFIAINAASPLQNGDNVLARWATLVSMAEDESYSIDNYVSVTADWARTPDGRHFSNKPPGPMLLGFPVFWLFDNWMTIPAADRAERDELRVRYRDAGLLLLSLLLQVLPFAVLSALTLGHLREQRVSQQGLRIAALALLFGNTAAVFMNSYFGHAMAAVGTLGICLALLQNRMGLVGFWFGIALLCDFGAAMFALPLFAVCIVRSASRWRALAAIGLGGLLPAALWCHYHITNFGSPFVIADKYVNPMFVNRADSSYHLWGIISMPPMWDVVYQLLFGEISGIAWTQPWLLLLIFSLPWVLVRMRREGNRRYPDAATLTAVAIPGLVLLILANASFGGWHNGGTPGPRYLCSLFPMFAVLLGSCFDSMGRWLQRAHWLLVGVMCFYFALVYSTSLFTGLQHLWPLYWSTAIMSPKGDSAARLVMILSAFALAALWDALATPRTPLETDPA